ncbi:MAG: HD domain-containing phosphohydrolase [Spirochaetia bacterium]
MSREPVSILMVTPDKDRCSKYAAFLAPVKASLTLHHVPADAVKAAGAERYSLFILDQDRDKDIEGVCRRLRESSLNPGTPLIIISDFDREEEIDAVFAEGASAYIPRKEVRSRLTEQVLELLQNYHFKRGQTVLVVDDSKPARQLIFRILGAAGFQVITASDGLEALMVLDINKVHLILSDIEMPNMDGLRFYREVLKKDKLRTVPFIVMSGTFGHGRMKRMINLGCAGYILKPFDGDYLVSMIERILSDNYLILLKEREMLTKEQRTFIGIIASLVSALEAKDPYTRGHSRNVSAIMVSFGDYLGLDRKEIDLYRISGELHDIGKIGIPDQILLKAGPLSDEEFEEIKKHPLLGEKIISSVPSLRNSANIIRHHHERFDGKGYPDGIGGEDIPFCSRLLSVADAYDALTSDRPYRRGKKHGDAMKVIEKAAGSQFCPEAVRILSEVSKKKYPYREAVGIAEKK